MRKSQLRHAIREDKIYLNINDMSNNQELNGLVDDLQKGVKTNDWKRAKTASEKIDRLLNDWKLDQMG